MLDDLLLAILAILLGLGGCPPMGGDPGDDDDSTPDQNVDSDGDGVTIAAGDCYDDNPDVFPGQTTAFEVDRGDGSYDYNCDGVEQVSDPDFRDPTCDLAACNSRQPGWLEAGASLSWPGCSGCVPLGTVPGCGEEGWWDGGYCQLDTGEFGAPVACHGPDSLDIYPVTQSCL